MMPKACRHALRAGVCALLALPLAGCFEQPLSILDPAGPGAAPITQVWWVMFWGSLAIYLLVLGLATYALLHRRRNGQAPRRALLIGGGLALPIVVVFLLLAYGIRSGQAMLPLPTSQTVFRVDVRGHQWWWEVSYPDAPGGALYSANEIHIPAGVPVDVHVSTEDVIHGFWVPRLGGKIDAIPGRTNVIRLRADAPGEYHGVCAEYCGVQHARMALVVYAHPAEDMPARLAALAGAGVDDPADLQDTQGARDFTQHCLACHAMNPRERSSQPGPNLADLGVRAMLGAGTLENTPEALRDWLRHHQARKPGNRMPQAGLPDAGFDAIADFLEHSSTP
ncbi:cytochrome c oxidase subunit II [Verticiella sediminum]|uniref:cytochrome-c oxidase n=1 Tax=Verticiella sediminum TaxID=1247510 RepID=A0A556AB54_9BURK|nr:cytochrome c oxidase subunit II [Verticiella sediminum]TSH90124.1 cytochrome c oxidase subunit II [Verticiella sediminum]